MQVFDRMTGYYPGSTPQHPQRLIGDARRNLGQGAGVKAMAEYLASINLSKDESWNYPFKTLPRPTGRATRVVITEYDLPRKQIQPHDVVVDSDGIVWFSHFGEQFLGKMDPKTGKVWEYPIPVIKAGFPHRHARSQDRQGRQSLGRHDVSGRRRAFRQEDRDVQGLVDPEGMADRRGPVGTSRSVGHAYRRQGVGQELRPLADSATRSRDRTMGESRLIQRSGKREASRRLRHPGRPRQQSLSARLLLLECGPDRRQDRPVHDLSRRDP